MDPGVSRYFPLCRQQFDCDTHAYKLTDGLSIVSHTDIPPVAPNLLGTAEFDELHRVRRWLRIDAGAFTAHSGSALAHQFVYALYLLRPTPLALHHMLWMDSDGMLTGRRLISRATHNCKDVSTAPFTVDELSACIPMFHSMIDIPTDSRLGLALSLSIESTWAHRWHVAIMLAAAAVEAILTWSEHHRVAKRLATAYAALTCPTDIEAARNEFINLHHLRSKIVHGRLPAPTSEERLEILASWSRVLRALWRAILCNPERIAALQSEDALGGQYFRDLTARLGWSAPGPHDLGVT